MHKRISQLLVSLLAVWGMIGMSQLAPVLAGSFPLSKQVASLAQTGVPVRLKIPAIGVDATIEIVGQTQTGSMDVPADARNVAWYKLGPAPGDSGNAVISGHLDDKKGPTVFWKLGKLKVGDKVTVIDSTGSERVFAVIAKEAYAFDKAPINKIFGFDLEHDLNLITCGGRWNPKTHNYSQRLVVYTRLIQ